MKVTVILVMLTLAGTAPANPVKKSDLHPAVEEPVIPGTEVPLEKLNTAPTSPPIEEQEEDSRYMLKARPEAKKKILKENTKETNE